MNRKQFGLLLAVCARCLVFAGMLGLMNCAGEPSLKDVARNGNVDAVQVLLEAGADVQAKGRRGLTALMTASYPGHSDIVQFLLEAGADVQARSTEGTTALMFAAGQGQIP